MNVNTNLNRAKQNKNDEFYTRYEDIELELPKYKNQFIGKVVYCNCDCEESAFVKFFKDHFDDFELKDFIYTYDDFRSDKNIELLKSADIIVTNPPFSLFREYVATLMEYRKEFLIIGNVNAITYKELFPLLKNNKVRLGYSRPYKFDTPNGMFQVVCRWFTNLDIQKRHEEIVLYKPYSPEEYPKYDNYDAINVDRVSDIPKDYDGVMGVPITFFDKYNPSQFEIIGASEQGGKGFSEGLWDSRSGVAHPMVKGIKKYSRLFIRRKQ